MNEEECWDLLKRYNCEVWEDEDGTYRVRVDKALEWCYGFLENDDAVEPPPTIDKLVAVENNILQSLNSFINSPAIDKWDKIRTTAEMFEFYCENTEKTDKAKEIRNLLTKAKGVINESKP